MVAKFPSWRKQIKQHRRTIQAMAIILVVVIALIIVGYRFDWTGFNGNNKSGKTLWDWLQLLIIPVVLAVGGYLFNLVTSRNDQEITTDNQREAALQTYIDKMSELILEKKLRESVPDDEVRTVARTRTLNILPRLDSSRKRSVLLFLYESGLIYRDAENIINLSGADLREADLNHIELRNVNLQKVNLQGANLYNADLRRADLRSSTLLYANLEAAFLDEALLYHVPPTDTQEGVARIVGADLSYANLREASLTGAKLEPSFTESLEGLNHLEMVKSSQDIGRFVESIKRVQATKLYQTDLSSAILEGAIVSTEQLETAKSLQSTTMPDGSKHP